MHTSIQSQVTSAPTSDLVAYQGEWNFAKAAHLLRRTLYGPTQSMIESAVGKGLSATVDELLVPNYTISIPINYYYKKDPDVPVGQTWIDQPMSAQNLKGYRRNSLAAWTMGLALNQGTRVREKMFLFWHNHFAISDIQDPRFTYKYSMTLRKNALGNFRELTKKMTVEPAMLRYLNGNQNSKNRPNENYARELLELFTIGKGPLAGPGDYTHYTEEDISEVARVLTGWVDRGFNKIGTFSPRSDYLQNRHDRGTKKLSARFGHATITDKGSKEYAHLIDLIFEQEEVSRFISRKLYRWFVYHKIDDNIEKTVIEPMAKCLREQDYEVSPVLQLLFNSAHFYDQSVEGAIIKSPMDHTLSMINQLEVPIPKNFKKQYEAWYLAYRMNDQLQQKTFYVPDVAGWKAYYQEPAYYQTWINSTTLQKRKIFGDLVMDGKLNTGSRVINNVKLLVDPFKVVEQIEDNLNPTALIESLATIFFPKAITEKQVLALKEVLLPGLPDYEWTVEFGDYLATPSDKNLKNSIAKKLGELFKAMMAMPEYYLI